jgi:hypothetical protein
VGISPDVSWEESMFGVFDDLEQQAEGLHLVERDAEVAELSVAEYARISVGARLHASLGQELRVRLAGGRELTGRLTRVGEDWMLLVGGTSQWIVRYDGITLLGGLSPRADSEETWSVMDRLSLRAALRRLSGVTEPCLVHFVDAHLLEGRIGRVGRDFFEFYVGEGPNRSVQVVPVTTVAALQGRVAQ